MEYLIFQNGQTKGPFTIDALRTMRITPDTQVLPQGMTQWIPAGQVEELRSLFVAQSASSPQYQQTDSQQSIHDERAQPVQETSNTTNNSSSANNNNKIWWWIIGILMALWIYGKIHKNNTDKPVQTKCHICGKIRVCRFYDGAWYCEENCYQAVKWVDEEGGKYGYSR